MEQIQDREQLFLSRQAKVTDAGEGLNIFLTITHPNLPSYREGTRADAQLTYSPRPCGRAYLRTDLCPDSELIERAGSLLVMRNSESVDQIHDRELLFLSL